MKTRKILLVICLISNSLLLVSQVNPACVELINNGVKLDAKFFSTNMSAKAPAVILLHGFPGSQTSPLGLAERLNNAGFNILVFNYQGSYKSEGNFSFDNCIDNVSIALDFILDPEIQTKYNIDTSKIVVCGYSFGGTIAIESAMYDNKIKNIISIANDDHSVSIKKTATDIEYRKGYEQFIAKSFAPEGPFRGDLNALMDYNIQNVNRYDLVMNADKLSTKKVLFIVGWQDRTSLIEVNTLPLYRKLQQLNAENISIKGFESDHRFGNMIDEITNIIIDWTINNAL